MKLEKSISIKQQLKLKDLTDEKELLRIFDKNNISTIDPTSIQEPGLFTLVAKTSGSAETQAALIRPVCFIGYKWGDKNQDDKVEKFFQQFDFYQLVLAEKGNLSFKEFVINFLQSLDIYSLKSRPAGITNTTTVLEFVDDSCFAQFNLNWIQTNSVTGKDKYFLRYPPT